MGHLLPGTRFRFRGPAHQKAFPRRSHKNAFVHARAVKHATLVDQFAYPHGGTGELYKRMACYVQKHGGTVECGRAVQRVLVRDGRVEGLELADGERLKFDQVISTMPPNLLVTRLPEVPADIARAAQSSYLPATPFSSILKSKRPIFSPTTGFTCTRRNCASVAFTNFRNWVPQLHGTEKATILALEYWCDRGGHTVVAIERFHHRNGVPGTRPNGLLGGRLCFGGPRSSHSALLSRL